MGHKVSPCSCSFIVISGLCAASSWSRRAFSRTKSITGHSCPAWFSLSAGGGGSLVTGSTSVHVRVRNAARRSSDGGGKSFKALTCKSPGFGSRNDPHALIGTSAVGTLAKSAIESDRKPRLEWPPLWTSGQPGALIQQASRICSTGSARIRRSTCGAAAPRP
jgi:hypothetical protein